MKVSSDSLQALETTLKALSDDNRIRILKMLQCRSMCVCEIAYVLDIAQPSVSRHLKKLKKAGLIDSESNGPWTNYFIKPGGEYACVLMGTLAKWLDTDEVIAADRARMQTADRGSLCCK